MRSLDELFEKNKWLLVLYGIVVGLCLITVTVMLVEIVFPNTPADFHQSQSINESAAPG